MRRSEPQQPAAPEPLCRFVAAEWPGEDDPFKAWCTARFRYAVDTYPGPLGNPVDVMRENREITLQRLGRGEL